MDDEIIIIISPKRQQVAGQDVVADEANGVRRNFTGPDRFKKAAKFLRALAEVTED